MQQPERSSVGADERDKELEVGVSHSEHLVITMQSKHATRTLGQIPNRINVFSMAKVGRQGDGCHEDCLMEIEDKTLSIGPWSTASAVSS